MFCYNNRETTKQHSRLANLFPPHGHTEVFCSSTGPTPSPPCTKTDRQGENISIIRSGDSELLIYAMLTPIIRPYEKCCDCDRSEITMVLREGGLNHCPRRVLTFSPQQSRFYQQRADWPDRAGQHQSELIEINWLTVLSVVTTQCTTINTQNIIRKIMILNSQHCIVTLI